MVSSEFRENPTFSMTSSKHENIFLRIYKDMNRTCKMDYSPRPENNILSLYKEMNVDSKMQYSSNTVNELRHIARQRVISGFSRLRKAGLIAAITRDKPASGNDEAVKVVPSKEQPKSSIVADWFRGRAPEQHNKSVTDGVKSSLMDAPVPAIEAPILILKPVVSRSTVSKIYKTKSVINKFAKWIEGFIPEEPKRVVNDKLEKAKNKDKLHIR